MALLDVVFRVLDKAGSAFIEPRREDGHGSSAVTPTFVDTGLNQPTTPADTQPISATALPLPTGAATEAKQLPDNHNVTVSNLPLDPLTGTNSSVSASVTAVTLLASNGTRRGATVYNDSTSPLKLSLGSVVTASSFTLIVAGGGYYEVPFGYRGAITGLWAAAIGAARVTELT